MTPEMRIEVAPGAIWLKRFLAEDEQVTIAGAGHCAPGRTTRRLRPDGARWRQDARPHAVPRPSLESTDLPLRSDARRSRWRARRADPGRVGGHRTCCGWRGWVRLHTGRLSDQLVRRRRSHGPPSGQGREPGVDRVRVRRSYRCRLAIRPGFCSEGCGGGIRWTRCGWSRGTRSSSAVRPDSGITA